MRLGLSALGLAVIAQLVSASPHAAAERAPAQKPTAIDAQAVADKLEVYRDDTGKYYVSPRAGALDADIADWLFYGDAKALHQQRVIGTSRSAEGTSWTVWSPRVRELGHANVELAQGELFVSCKPKHKRPLTQLAAADAKAFIAKAKFFTPLWPRQAHFLARDDDGVYFFVDELLPQHGGNGHRVFVGRKGAMKELAMTNVVSDTGGKIFATKTGELKIVAGADGKAYWKKGGKRTDLVVLDLLPNRYLIYRELGIYGQLGIVCDDH